MHETAEIRIESFVVQVGGTRIRIDRDTFTEEIDGIERWIVRLPNDASLGGLNPRGFDSHVAAQRFAAEFARAYDDARTAHAEQITTVRNYWTGASAPSSPPTEERKDEEVTA